MTITYKDSLGAIVRVLKTITDPKQGQECVVLWTNCNNQYEAKGIIAGVNKSSVGVTITEDVAYPAHYEKPEAPAYRKGQHIRVPKWPNSTGKNGVFEVTFS
jgi:hypothetical protein